MLKIQTQLAFISASLLLAGGPIVSPAFAQDQGSQTSDQQTPGQSTAQAPANPESQGLGLNKFALRPQAGAINFNGNSRLSTGLLSDFKFFHSDIVDLGFEFGGLFSGLNNTINGGSGFTSGVSSSNSTYIVQVPTELQIKILPGLLGNGHFSFGPSVGADTIYSSSGIGNSWGTNSGYVTPSQGQGAKWNPHFAIGPEVNYAVSSAMDIGLRLDNTIMSAFTMRTLTLSLGFKLS